MLVVNRKLPSVDESGAQKLGSRKTPEIKVRVRWSFCSTIIFHTLHGFVVADIINRDASKR